MFQPMWRSTGQTMSGESRWSERKKARNQGVRPRGADGTIRSEKKGRGRLGKPAETPNNPTKKKKKENRTCGQKHKRETADTETKNRMNPKKRKPNRKCGHAEKTVGVRVPNPPDTLKKNTS